MKERPILFNGPMVMAILEGRKTQTRMVVKDVSADCELFIDAGDGFWQQCYRDNTGAIHSKSWLSKCPYGKPGDRLWVRETFGHNSCLNCPIHYRSDEPEWKDKSLNPNARWYPSIHMPRWASRILLEIVSVRVERLQDISEADALAEGIQVDSNGHAITSDDDIRWLGPRTAFCDLWQSINGPCSWKKNPWVWVIEFRVI